LKRLRLQPGHVVQHVHAEPGQRRAQLLEPQRLEPVEDLSRAAHVIIYQE
jgi:hypothetical protein